MVKAQRTGDSKLCDPLSMSHTTHSMYPSFDSCANENIRHDRGTSNPREEKVDRVLEQL